MIPGVEILRERLNKKARLGPASFQPGDHELRSSTEPENAFSRIRRRLTGSPATPTISALLPGENRADIGIAHGNTPSQ